MKRFLVFLLVLPFAVLIIPGCGQKYEPQGSRGQVISYSVTATYSTESMDALVSQMDSDYKTTWIAVVWNIFKPLRLYTNTTSVKICYWTKDANNRAIQVSGAFIYPTSTTETINIPILCLAHPAQTLRAQSPSLKSGIYEYDNQMTIPSALLFATMGYAVVIPDYPGLGINTDAQPYGHASLGNSVIDMARASISVLNSQGLTTKFNNKVYMMGFSEGGYAVLNAAKEVQANYSTELSIEGVAVLDAPLSVSQSMRNVILTANQTYSSPYFLAYFLASYDSIYRNAYMDFNFYNCVTPEAPGYPSFSDDLYNKLNGLYTETQISDFMKNAKISGQYIGPRSILSGRYLYVLTNEASVVVQTYVENDAFYSWTPRMPVKIFHNYFDDLIPVDNLDRAKATWEASIGSGSFSTFYYRLPYLENLVGSIHAATLPYAYFLGFNWIDSLAYPSRP